MKTTVYSIREYLTELRSVKSRHPEVLNELKDFWSEQLYKRLIINNNGSNR